MNGSDSRKKRARPGPKADDKGGISMEHRPGFTGWITRAAARHPWRTLGLWVLLVVAAFGASGAMNISSETATAGTEATRAKDLIRERLRQETPPEEFLIVESQTATADQAAFSHFVDSLVSDLRALEEVDSVVSYRDGAEGLVSEDGHVALVAATLTGAEEDAADTAKPLVGVVEDADGTEGFRVTTVGFGSVEGEINTLLQENLRQGEMIGIGVGIDYSLFIVQRFREERARGREKIEAITTAGSTASRTVFFSGMAVAIALAGMLIMPDPVFQSFAVGAMLVVAATVLASLTLLPAVLGLLGDRLNWLTLPFIGRRGEAESTGGVWGWTTKLVTARPVLSVVVTGGLLVAAALPVSNINLGNIGISTLPEDSNPRHAFDVLNEEFSDGVLTADIVIDAADVNARAVQADIAKLTDS